MSSIGHLPGVRMAFVVASVTACSASALGAHANGVVEAIVEDDIVRERTAPAIDAG
jgi:hypothetical protein